MRYRIRHETVYDYSEPVTLCWNLARLKPREATGQTCVSARIAVEPAPAAFEERPDYFGNPTAYFSVQEPHLKLRVESQLEVDRHAGPEPDTTAGPAWEIVRVRLAEDLAPEILDAGQFRHPSRFIVPSDETHSYALLSFPAGRPLLAGAVNLASRIHRDFIYDPRATTVATPLAEVLAKRRGVCQDFAHLQIACMRSLGLAARYVSGYLATVPEPGKQRLIGADASHAWVDVFCPENGWVGLDPTNDRIVGDRHVLLAWGRDFEDVSPVKGFILGGGRHKVRVGVDVEPV